MYCTTDGQRSCILTFWSLATLLTPLHSFSMHQIVKHTTRKAAKRLSVQTLQRTQHPHIQPWIKAHILQNSAARTPRTTGIQEQRSKQERNLLIFYASASLIALTIHKKQLDNEHFLSSLATKLIEYFRQFTKRAEHNLPADPTKQSHYLCSTEEGHLCLHPALDDIYRMRSGEETSSS